MTHVTLLLPVFNEQESILPFFIEFEKFIQDKSHQYSLLFINDGSTDKTFSLLKDIAIATKEHKKPYQVKVINLSRNFGKESALCAGFDYTEGDVVIPYDIDMQDPLIVINDLIQEWNNGFAVVNAKRIDRKKESVIKRGLAHVYYKLLKYLTDSTIEEQIGDFRLLDSKVVRAFSLLREKNRFTKGLMSWVGFKTTTITYSRVERKEGETKFSFRKLLKLGLDGIFAFSDKPIRISAYIGLSFMLVAFGLGLDILIKTLLFGNTVAGYPSLMVVILFSFGLLFLMQGIQGEYIARIYNEVKDRPIYIIDEIID